MHFVVTQDQNSLTTSVQSWVVQVKMVLLVLKLLQCLSINQSNFVYRALFIRKNATQSAGQHL